MTLFYCAHWQAYVTGTLKLGRIDVTEAQYSIIAIQLLSATLGPSFWASQVMISIWNVIVCLLKNTKSSEDAFGISDFALVLSMLVICSVR